MKPKQFNDISKSLDIGSLITSETTFNSCYGIVEKGTVFRVLNKQTTSKNEISLSCNKADSFDQTVFKFNHKTQIHFDAYRYLDDERLLNEL